ncbi:hypothetical protein [Parasutterella excrementihominis]|uniref:hypothetical protein n=1 Tax=Parasutterella excrementihominis TaxID=487175 RepID=UPI00242C0931|nr:hypothetical protein [Parasutterella excrementihominis]
MNKPLSISEIKVPALSAETLDRVRQFENALEKCPQVEINVESVLFAGIYARTIKIPAGVVITGALLQVPTVLQISGRCILNLGEQAAEINGYAVFKADAGRKQVIYALTDTFVTASFATTAQTVEEAENEATAEAEKLTTRRTNK